MNHSCDGHVGLIGMARGTTITAVEAAEAQVPAFAREAQRVRVLMASCSHGHQQKVVVEECERMDARVSLADMAANLWMVGGGCPCTDRLVMRHGARIDEDDAPYWARKVEEYRN